jgi:very-short-patch-repair endonuclease
MPTIRPTNPHARTLRREATDAERALWARVRNRQVDGHKIRFQATVGRYVVDFLCAAKGLVIELDGSQHSEGVDRARTAWLEGQGYRVIRFSNIDVLHNLDGVLEAIRLQLADLPDVHDSPSPNPLPQAGEGF